MATRWLVPLGLALVTAALLAACGGGTPTPTPTRTPTRAPATTAAPTTAAPTTPASGGQVTKNWRVLADQRSYAPFIEGWREMLDRATGGRITMTPQDANEQQAVDWINRNKDQYENLIFRLNEDHVPLWRMGLNFTGGQVIEPHPMNVFTTFAAACMDWLTLDPNIRTIHDFTGKKVLMGQPGNTVLPVAQILVKAAGMEGKFTPVIGGAKPGDQVLADREVDVVGTGIIFAGHPLGSSTSQYNQIAQLTKSLYFVDSTLPVIEKAREQNPAWVQNGLLPPVKIYKGDLSRAANVDYDIVREDGYCVGSITVNFQVSPNANEQAVYETVKGILEYRQLSEQYFPFIAKTWQERLGHTWNPQSSFHPGARRAYEEMGVTYGIEGIRAWEAANPR